MIRSRARWPVSALLATGLLTAVAPVALAQDETDISNVGVVSSTVDIHEGVASITFTVDCNIDIFVLRFHATLRQRNASAIVTTERSCSAGQTFEATIDFGRQEGVFRPGPASLDGFVSAFIVGDVDDIPVDQVLLRPAQAGG